MPAPEQVLTAALIALMVAVLLAFTFGTQRNISRGNALLRWLQDALPSLGGHATLRWLGSSVVEVRLTDAREPFRELMILAVMEPRDVPILWVLARTRGRHDLLIVRGSFRGTPPFELDVLDPGAWSTAPMPLVADGWTSIDWVAPARAHVRGEADPATVEAVRAAWAGLDAASRGACRITVRRTPPHFEVQVRPPDPARVASGPLVAQVQALAAAVAPRA